MFGSTRKMLPFKAASQNKIYSFNNKKKSVLLDQKETENTDCGQLRIKGRGREEEGIKGNASMRCIIRKNVKEKFFLFVSRPKWAKSRFQKI